MAATRPDNYHTGIHLSDTPLGDEWPPEVSLISSTPMEDEEVSTNPREKPIHGEKLSRLTMLRRELREAGASRLWQAGLGLYFGLGFWSVAAAFYMVGWLCRRMLN